MKRILMAAMLAGATFCTTAATAATTIGTSGGTRGLTIASYGAVGQSFTAVGNQLQSVGFELATTNGTAANDPLTLSIYAGTGAGGALIAQSSLTAPLSAARTVFWQDFMFNNVALTDGGIYTALLSTGSSRLAVRYGPTLPSTLPAPGTGADAYKGGSLISTTAQTGYCTTDACDANFRVTMASVASAVPEPASWALMLAGFAMVGGATRYRRRTVRFAA